MGFIGVEFMVGVWSLRDEAVGSFVGNGAIKWIHESRSTRYERGMDCGTEKGGWEWTKIVAGGYVVYERFEGRVVFSSAV